MHRVVDPGARLADDLGRVGEVGRGLALAVARLDPPEQELDRLVEELDRLEDVVGEPELERLRGADQAVLLQGVVHDQPDGCLGAHEPRRQLRPAPGGEEPEEDLGEAEVADVRGDGADVAVERDLEPAAERRAVDGRERRERQLAQPAEQLVARLSRLRGRARE